MRTSFHGIVNDRSDLIDRRAELIDQQADDGDEFATVTAELTALLGDGSRSVRRLVPGHDDDLIARLGALEPVNPLRDERDLADRVDADRRCFVLEHPQMPDRPITVVWVALSEVPFSTLDDVLDWSTPAADPASATVATFYSIWNVEPGLVGLPAGHDLLSGALAALDAEFPGLAEFRTLSPVPGLRRHLDGVDPEAGADALRGGRVVAAARYLTTLREDGRPIDPVARFHLRNGARLAAVLPDADLSELGMSRSFGVMCSYRYEPEDRAANRAELIAGSVPVSESVRALLS